MVEEGDGRRRSAYSRARTYSSRWTLPPQPPELPDARSPLTLAAMRCRSALLSLTLLAATAACGRDQSASPGDSPSTGTGGGSFDQIQRTVLTPTCAVSGCHASALPSSGNPPQNAGVRLRYDRYR